MSDCYDFSDYDDEELLERRNDVWDSARVYGEELIGKYKYSAEEIVELEKTRRHFLEVAWAMDEEAEKRGLDID